jgi:hypothetical protein
VGDQHNEAFGFVSFFPKRLHPAVTVATTACFRVAEHCPCCATLHEQKRKVVNVMKHQALPGHTQSEAERYRSRCTHTRTHTRARAQLQAQAPVGAQHTRALSRRLSSFSL